jgi:hypothetical protein
MRFRPNRVGKPNAVGSQSPHFSNGFFKGLLESLACAK